jgi:hypothetical protein
MAIRITCINKSGGHHADPHHAIEYLGWINEESGKTGKNTRLEIYNWVKDENGTAYVRDSKNNNAFVGIRENSNGTKFLQTYADKVWTDNLLELPECRS